MGTRYQASGTETCARSTGSGLKRVFTTMKNVVLALPGRVYPIKRVGAVGSCTTPVEVCSVGEAPIAEPLPIDPRSTATVNINCQDLTL